MIKICTKCLMPTSRPRVVFNEDGVCNACTNAQEKQQVDWEARAREFAELIEKNRPKSSEYDCIVPWSGGKDSSMIALRLKEEFNLNPLLVTCSPMIPSEVGMHNREEVLKVGFDQVFVRPNQRVARHLARRFFIERGNPKVCWEASVTATPIQMALKLGIPLILYAEHGESEYGGKVLSEKHKKQRDIAEFLEHLVGDDPMNWMDNVVEERDLSPYLFPDPPLLAEKNVRAMYFGYFFQWDVYDNYRYCAERTDFQLAPGGRTSGTFTAYDSLDDKIDNLYYYMQFIKFGFGRGVRDASRLIQLGHMTRADALEMANRYDDEFPEVYLPDVLEYLGMDRGEFVNAIDKHRNPEIWSKEDNVWTRSFDIV